MNPIIATAGVFGAQTLNLVIFNEAMNKYWLIPTGIDESWIIESKAAHEMKSGGWGQRDPYGRQYPSVALAHDVEPAPSSEVVDHQGAKDSHRLLAGVNGWRQQWLVG